MTTVVFVTESGIASEIVLDMSESKDSVSEILGYNKTFVGQIDEDPLNTFIVVMCKIHLTEVNLIGNNPPPHKLPKPLQNEVVYGDLLYIRMEHDSNTNSTFPVDFPLTDYKNLSFE